jgi:hypothetical protein
VKVKLRFLGTVYLFHVILSMKGTNLVLELATVEAPTEIGPGSSESVTWHKDSTDGSGKNQFKTIK